MRRIISAVAATAAIVSGAAAIPASASAKSCPSWDTPGVIGGVQKCLGAGEFCARSESSQYHRYGFNCVRYPSGYYHLRRR